MAHLWTSSIEVGPEAHLVRCTQSTDSMILSITR